MESVGMSSKKRSRDAMLVEKLPEEIKMKDEIVEKETEETVHLNGGDNGQRKQEYVSLLTSDLPQLPPFHYQTVVTVGRVTQRTAWSELATMKELLRPQHLVILDSYPQIGSFLRLTGKGQFKASTLHNLMIRMCLRETNMSMYEYWFLINGKPIRFGLEEFSLVSGLRFGNPNQEANQHILKGGTLKNIYFGQWGDTKVTVVHLKTKITAMLNANENDEDICKLLFAWVLSALLLPTRPTEVVENLIFALCDNLEICERYPWANLVWRITLDELMAHICSNHHMTSDDNVRRLAYGGFPHIILFWMLEAIEGMSDAANCFPRNDPNVPRYPRMLRWDIGCGNFPNCNTMDEFFGQVQVVIPRLMPDQTELMIDYYRLTKIYFDSLRLSNRMPSYRLLTEFFGDQYSIVRDNEGHHEYLNRPPNQGAHAPAPAPAPARDTAHVRRQPGYKCIRINDGVSSSRAQPQSSSEPMNEEIPIWAHDLEQRLRDYHTAEIQKLVEYQVQMEHKLLGQMNTISDTQTQIQVTMAQLQELMLKDFQSRGISVDDEDNDDEEDGNGEAQVDR